MKPRDPRFDARLAVVPDLRGIAGAALASIKRDLGID